MGSSAPKRGTATTGVCACRMASRGSSSVIALSPAALQAPREPLEREFRVDQRLLLQLGAGEQVAPEGVRATGVVHELLAAVDVGVSELGVEERPLVALERGDRERLR